MGSFTYYSDVSAIQLAEVGGRKVSWLKAMNLGEYKHPVFGDIKFDPTRVQRFAENIKNRVRGVDPDIDYDHKQDPAKGNKAAGWVKDAEARGDGLHLFVEWTEDGAAAIRSGEWRYFSPEFTDEWTDPQGTKYSDVLFGGALTNRPFLKDLLPVNLSELTFGEPSTKKEEEVDPKRLRELLGLPETATDAEVDTKSVELNALSEALKQKGTPPTPVPPQNVPPVPPVPPAPTFQLTEDMKKLADQNPAIKMLLEQVQSQAGLIQKSQVELREASVQRQLAEFDTTNVVLTPVAKTLVYEIMTHKDMPSQLNEKLWELLKHVKTSSTFVVELGERAASSAKVGRERSAEQAFTDAVNKVMGETQGMAYADAVTRVAADNPQLYSEYRDESFAFKE